MIRTRLDAKGRLIALGVRPAATPSAGSAAPDWLKLFAAAELDPARFTPVAPSQVPPMPFDARGAWEGTFEPGRPERVHVEAAAWTGNPVYFSVGGDWQQQEPSEDAAILTWQNLRKGRGDRRGALQLATTVFLAAMLG
jgi:hypothetical protein